MSTLSRSQKTTSTLLAILAASSVAGAAAEDANTTATTKSTATPASAVSQPAAAATSDGPANTVGNVNAGKVPASADKDEQANVFGETTPMPKMLWKPGQEISTTTDIEDVQATYDIDLARRQVAAYPDSPEAAFILAVALTRTSRVEEALKVVQHARRLANSNGGAGYFDKMIASYEKMLLSFPDDNRVRYGLAWAYYMKAYLIGENSRRQRKFMQEHQDIAAKYGFNKDGLKIVPNAGGTNGGAAQAATTNSTTTATQPSVKNSDVVKALTGGGPNSLNDIAALAAAAATTGQLPPNQRPHIPTAMEMAADPSDVPEIRKNYESAMQKLDEILKREPDDVWTIVYRAHLRAEYSGDLEAAMGTWRGEAKKHPDNPAPYFFLGEGYLKQGNLKESIENVSKAIALRAIGKETH